MLEDLARPARVGGDAQCGDEGRNQAAGDNAAAHGPGDSTEMIMSARRHAATRRELLLGSGALFAWAFVPKIARAEGRDPRFLTIVLRGGLDGLAAVAPIGDPDWIKLRGDNALRLDGATPALPLDGFFALNPAMPNSPPALSRRPGHRGARGGHAVPRALAFRRAGRAAERLRATRTRGYRLAQSRADQSRTRRHRTRRNRTAGVPTRSARSRRWWCAVRRRCCRGRRHGCRR